MVASRGFRITVAAASVAALLAVGAAPALGVPANAYLDDYSSADGLIVPDQGNLSGLSGGVCRLLWDVQAVVDSDLTIPALGVVWQNNGFLQNVSPLGDPLIAGSGYASIQHYPISGVLYWRIPVAVDRRTADAVMTIIFDDPDWVVDTSYFEQFSPFAAPWESAFHRFTGITGYPPHDDTQVSAAAWGTDGGGHTTLEIELGNLEAATSTMFMFRGSPAVAANLTNGVAMGARAVVTGTQRMARCVQHEYQPVEVHQGQTAGSELPGHVDGTMSLPLSDPAALAGATYSLGAGAPAGATIGAASGIVSWPVPANAPLGALDIPTVITFADGSERTADFRVTVLEALPPTGAQPPLWLLGVAGLLGLGGLLLSRRAA